MFALAAFLFHMVTNGSLATSGRAASPGASSVTVAPPAAADAGADNDGEGPWLASRPALHAETGIRVCKPAPPGSTMQSAVCEALSFSKPAEVQACALDPVCQGRLRSYFVPERWQIQFLIASVPDPQQTRLALFTDAAINAVQQAAFDAHWELATQWLPWRPQSGAGGKTSPAALKATSASRGVQPGLLVFRHSPVDHHFDSRVLFVFIVGETPTSGLNVNQFQTARAYMRALGDPDVVRVVGPCFSGSIFSLTQLVAHDRKGTRQHPYRFRINSGTATSRMLLTAFEGVPDIDIHGSNLNNVDEEKDFLRVLSLLRIHQTEAAILIEDESAYSRNLLDVVSRTDQDATYPLVLRYPRDISNLRNRYRDSPDIAISDKTTQPVVDFSLKDSDTGGDSLPMFSSDKSPVEQNAVLGEITAQIRREGIRLVKLSATNILDLLFLAKVLRTQCPDTRVLVTSPDFLFVAENQSTSLAGTLALSTYPLFFASKHWLGEHPATFSSSNEEGLYYAAELLLLSPDEQKSIHGHAWKGQRTPVSWLMTLDHLGFTPVRLMKNPNDHWFQEVESDRDAFLRLPRPPASWTIALFSATFLSLLVCGWIMYLRWNQHALSWSIVAPNASHIADAHRLVCLVCVLLLIAAMQAVLLLPLGPLCFSSRYLFQTLSAFVPVAMCGWLATRIVSAPRRSASRYVCLALGCLLPLAIVLLWAFCCYRSAEQSGFFFSFRSLELQSGSSPALPVLVLLSALLMFALCHLVRFYFAISHRPRMFVATLDQFFAFRMRNCRRDLNRLLVAPMNLSVNRQLAFAAAFLGATVLSLAAWHAGRKFASVEGKAYDFLLIGLVALVTVALAVTALQMRLAWTSLQPLLARLNTLPLRPAFTRISDIGKGGPIWARRLNLQSLAMPTSAVTLLRNLEVLSAQPSWQYDVSCQALSASRQQYSFFLSSLLEQRATREEKRQHFCSLRYVGAMLSHVVSLRILVPEWGKRILPSEALPQDKDEKAAAATPADAYEIAQSFVALQLSAFINYGVRQIQNLGFAVSLSFGLLVIALNLYSAQAPQAINRLLLIAFCTLGYFLWTVLSQMERDPILSQLSGTTEGHLNKEFYFKILGYAAIPALSLLTSQFPYISSFVSSWLEPSLEAIR